jgi:hypothetical protein
MLAAHDVFPVVSMVATNPVTPSVDTSGGDTQSNVGLNHPATASVPLSSNSRDLMSVPGLNSRLHISVPLPS